MNRNPRLSFTLLLLAGLAAGAAFAAETASPPPVVELNGLSCLFGSNLAMFHLVQPPAAGPADFSLAEGESRFGIKLLSVDISARTVCIDNSGQKQKIHICGTPVLACRAGAPDASLKTSRASNRNLNFASLNGNQTAGDPAHPEMSPNGSPVGFSGGGMAGTGAATSGNDNGSTDNHDDNAPAGSATDANDSNPAGDTAAPWWYNDAQKIEAARIESAGEVLAGNMDPLPLTPLTPPGTDSSLVGTDSVYFSFHRLHPLPEPADESAE